MKIHEIFYPEVDAYVKFKVLSLDNIESFMYGAADMHRQEFMHHVVSNFVFNLKSEIHPKLRLMDPSDAQNTLMSLFHGSIMLNPRLDVDEWIRISYTGIQHPVTFTANEDINEDFEEVLTEESPSAVKKIPKNKLSSIKTALQQTIIGQDAAIDTIHDYLKRSIVGLEDKDTPLGVFLACGSSGVGKTLLAKAVHNHLYGTKHQIVRIDCGQYQQKHQSSSLGGSSAGYIGYDDGGLLTNKVIENPNTVVLLDEVEKAHPDFWNVFLNVFDEGYLLDNKGNKADFTNAIIIMTTNLGNEQLLATLQAKSVGFGNNAATKMAKDRVDAVVLEKVRKYFKPELVNRIDKVIVFNHLNEDNLKEIANIEMDKVAKKLSSKGILFKWDDAIINHMVSQADSVFEGARGMAVIRRDLVESMLTDTILDEKVGRGSILELVADEDIFKINVTKPVKKTKTHQE